jgi:hypothetical protein
MTCWELYFPTISGAVFVPWSVIPANARLDGIPIARSRISPRRKYQHKAVLPAVEYNVVFLPGV